LLTFGAFSGNKWQQKPLSFMPQKMQIVRYAHRKFRWTITGHYVNGKRVRRFFTTKGEAETFIQGQQVKKENLGNRALEIDQHLHVMAIEAADRLRAFGKTIAQAADFYIQHLETMNRSCSVTDLIEPFINDKEADGNGKRYLQELRLRLKKFALTFGNILVAEINPAEIDDWLRGLPIAPLSRNNYRRILSTFFAYAVIRRYCSGNPVLETAKAKVKANPIEVLTPDKAQSLLDSADASLRPALAIGAFAGLRPAEISRLDWKEIKLERGYIEVTAANSKTASRRLVKITQNLRAWLDAAPKKSGVVLPPNSRKLIEAARARTHLEAWPSNALRHSYASYHLAQFHDSAALALEMGHATTAMLFEHYREVVTPEDAEAYWQISPPANSSISSKSTNG
jgi:integrase